MNHLECSSAACLWRDENKNYYANFMSAAGDDMSVAGDES